MGRQKGKGELAGDIPSLPVISYDLLGGSGGKHKDFWKYLNNQENFFPFLLTPLPTGHKS